MKVDTHRVKIHGRLLHRIVMHPPDGVPVRCAGIFYHGQGDYAVRYPDVLEPFTQRGIRCVVTELPGHGYSPGRRGHCGDVEMLDAIIDHTLQGFNGLPYAVMGHSMGGLLAARHLILAGQGRWPVPVFSWLNAPLIRPSYGRSELFLAVVKALAPLFPALTVSTGVTSQMCRVVGDESDAEEGGQIKERVRHPLWHKRISLGWGAVLFGFEQLLQSSSGAMSPKVPLLFTQGSADPVCPAKIAQDYFQTLPQKEKQYHEFDGGLHELFADEGRDRLTLLLNDWLDRL